MAKNPANKSNGEAMCVLRNREVIFSNLAVGIAEVARVAEVDPASVRRLKNGERVRRATGISILRALNRLESLDLKPETDLLDS